MFLHLNQLQKYISLQRIFHIILLNRKNTEIQNFVKFYIQTKHWN